jgi:hypothetical protein
MGAMCEEKRAEAGVVELPAIVALDFLDGGAELCACIGKKLDRVEKVSDFSFKGNVHRKCEQSSRMTK